MKNRGSSLIEVIIATVLLSGIGIWLALVNAKMMKSALVRGHRTGAVSLATSQMELLKSQSYQSLLLTPNTAFQNTAVCNCSSVDWSLIPSTPIATAQTLYAMQVCTSLVDTTGATSPCPNATDTGLKSITIRTSWGTATDPREYLSQSVVSRGEMLSGNAGNLGTHTLSGALVASEGAQPGLSGLTVELRDIAGNILTAVQTNGTGNYNFPSLPDATYTLTPSLPPGGSWTSNPLTQSVIVNGGPAAAAPFSISGVQATIPLTGSPGALALIMQQGTTPSGANPPLIDRTDTSSVIPAAYMKTLGNDGTGTLQVPPGYAYELTCWAFDPATGGYTREPTIEVSGLGVNLEPQSIVTPAVSCD